MRKKHNVAYLHSRIITKMRLFWKSHVHLLVEHHISTALDTLGILSN